MISKTCRPVVFSKVSYRLYDSMLVQAISAGAVCIILAHAYAHVRASLCSVYQQDGCFSTAKAQTALGKSDSFEQTRVCFHSCSWSNLL